MAEISFDQLGLLSTDLDGRINFGLEGPSSNSALGWPQQCYDDSFLYDHTSYELNEFSLDPLMAQYFPSDDTGCETNPQSTSTNNTVSFDGPVNDWIHTLDPTSLSGSLMHGAADSASHWLSPSQASQLRSEANDAATQIQPPSIPLMRRAENYTPYLSPTPSTSTPSVHRSLPPTPRLQQTVKLVPPPQISGSKRKLDGDSDPERRYEESSQGEAGDDHRARKRRRTRTTPQVDKPAPKGTSIVRKSLSGKAPVNRVRKNAKGLGERRSEIDIAPDLNGTLPGWILNAISKSHKERVRCELCTGSFTTLDRHILGVHRGRLVRDLIEKPDRVRPAAAYLDMFYFVIVESRTSSDVMETNNRMKRRSSIFPCIRF
ncbi:uncharacterized protein EI90DRAFT_1102438 [Cantharellus anzutake]|uniref:uncharacterized protein n=1 Tax=Cantharellus anzutake TaxID=1750568 RepID=UPI0019044127|nr:uncharacterized protein EI90DRAFT_1102438 [Cantharellus anzutake]KAF8330845.1 hypothetical protein EI90DRAFT_1102438 [Cantharellus anzutake]